MQPMSPGNPDPWKSVLLGFCFLTSVSVLTAVAQDGAVSTEPAIQSQNGNAMTDSTNQNYWAVEDKAARAKLPLYKIIPAAKPEELTPANGYPKRATFLTWHRSHGDNGDAWVAFALPQRDGK